jgi:25S rRNA (uracil2634-N3)-methyltransferase
VSIFLSSDWRAGDFSFALSLVKHHKCKYVTATCYDSYEALHEKYPQTRQILEAFLTHDGIRNSEDKQNLESREEEPRIPEGTVEEARDRDISSSEWEGLSPPASPDSNHPITHNISNYTNGSNVSSLNTCARNNISFHPSVSANNLPKYKPIRHKAPYNKIVFNFPHVGGLSTDVNRQVRANQELLVAFFKSCQPLLASKSNPVRDRLSEESDIENQYDDLGSDQIQEDSRDAQATGQIIISLFGGEPYSLWNIRDLARHSGYKVITSWRFPWKAYPGYRHARTIGEILRKSNGVEEVEGNRQARKKSGAWKGEEREARGFVFELVDKEDRSVDLTSKEKSKRHERDMGLGSKRKRYSDSESDD